MKNYEKLYKESLDKIQEVLNNAKKKGHIIVRVKDLENTFHELKESEDDKIRKMIINTLNRDKILTEDEAYDCVAWLEKQGKTILDGINVEPKFHEGDWIIRNNKYTGIPVRVIEFNGCYLCDLNGEIVTLTPNDVHNNFHLWSIKDAKDGDVLASNNGNTFIYHKHDSNYVYYHCSINYFDNITINSSWNVSGIKPTNKEQRDLLFQKMKEAGYEWDDEKKELKEIEEEDTDETKQECGSIDISGSIKTSRIKTLENLISYFKYERKATQREINTSFIPCLENLLKDVESTNNHAEWSEEDGRKIGTLSAIIFDYAFHKDAIDENNDLTGEYAELNNWLQFFPERFNIQPKQEWNGDDEQMFKQALKYLKQSYYTEASVIEWLKSLKDKVKPCWKPSEEQMKQLKNAANIYHNSRLGHGLKTLYEELNKLKER